MKHKLLIVVLLAGGSLLAQTKQERQKIAQGYDLQKLESVYEKIQESQERKMELVRKASKQNLWPVEVYKNGELYKKAVDVTENGDPVYIQNHNIDAAESTRTDYLQAAPYGLEGENMIIGLWEVGGIPLTTHVEYTVDPFNTTSRVINKESTSVANAYHATHVCGTLIARGVDPDAKGMAPKAEVYAYDASADLTEVIAEAANGLLVSNHSYGVPIFDPDNGSMNIPDYWPGKYRASSRNWDIVHYDAPNYLQVVSAGNEGEKSYAGSLAANRDKLVGNKVSKNNLVVANASDASIDAQGALLNVTINPSSSQGPTDDMRIKPDIAGNGTGLYSSINTGDTDYGFATGTSMAAPNVAGTLLLLQEYYHDLNGVYMRSATLKGLACHTADDAGSPGPDEEFGWGLLNAKKAAETINNGGTIQELTLNQGDTYSVTVTASSLEDLKASITWTDPAGSVADNQLNSPTPVLVNDLDIRITQNPDDTFLPWKLDFFDPAGDAIKGDNTVDNVERVDVENPSGTYTITVSHKGNLTSGSQDYSLIITGMSLGINEFDSSSISIWPNPANNSINFSHAAGFSEANIAIYDMNGRMVKSYEVENTNSFTANIANLEPGIYIAEISDGKNVYREKVIKQ